jgi:diguanylate cyclase (GGDEF)-like protein
VDSERISAADVLLGFERASKRMRRWAFGVSGVMVAVTAAALAARGVMGPDVRFALAMAGMWWMGADVLTAGILFAQFSVSGVARYAALGATYLISALLVVPFVGFFPGLILMTLTPGEAQVTPTIWLVRFAAFAICAALVEACDEPLRRRLVSRANAALATSLAVAGSFAAACALAFPVVAFRDRLPTMVAGTPVAFTAHYSGGSFALAALNLAVVAFIVARARRFDTLTIWMAVALLTAALGNVLNGAAPLRYSLDWYAAVLLAIVSSTVMLAALAGGIVCSYRALLALAGTDPLTELRNRRTFARDAGDALAEAARRGEFSALLVLDVDHFKRYNDRYGHAAGDEALRCIAALIVDAVRPTDVIGRHAGEEFVVFLPRTTLAQAASAAERIRRTIEGGRRSGDERLAAGVTISIGVAAAAPGKADVGALFARADRALYEAKRLGRNRVALAGDAPEPAYSAAASDR